MTERFVPIGRIVGAHGIRGEFKLEPYDGELEPLLELERLFVRASAEADPTAQTIETARPHKRSMLIKLDGTSTRNDAEAMIGLEVFIPEADQRRLPPGSFKLKTLLGLDVRDGAGKSLGRVADVDIASGRAILVVALKAGGQVLVPFVTEYVHSVESGGVGDSGQSGSPENRPGQSPDGRVVVTEAFERLLSPEEVGQ